MNERVAQRMREREREGGREGEGECMWWCVCVGVCMCVYGYSEMNGVKTKRKLIIEIDYHFVLWHV